MQIPQEEKAELEDLFKALMFQDSFAFTLFGSKPVSWESRYYFDSQKSKNPRALFMGFLRSTLKIKNGWKVWQKYCSLFPSSSYLFNGFEDDDSFSIVLINKKAFLKTASQYEKEFKENLGENFSPFHLLKECEQQEFSKVVQKHESLMGILLGFGRNNSFRFERLAHIAEFGKDRQLHLIKSPPPPNPDFNSIEEEFLDLKNRHQSFVKDTDVKISALILPSFAADPTDPETQHLKIKYMKQRRKILKKLAKGDFLEIILEQLTS
jgi:hypothetical protein